MGLTSVAIRRPVFILMVVSALIIMGLNAMGKMPIEENPKVELPVVVVVTLYPGAGPAEIESQITKQVEDAVASVNGIKTLRSASQEGLSTVTLEFNYGTSSAEAAADVREKVSAIRGSLPRAAEDPVVQRFDFNSQPILYYGLTGRRSSRDIRDIADNVIKQRLGKVNGVAACSILGGDIREISVAVRKERLDAYGISIQALVPLLQANNLNFPVGRVKEVDREYSIRLQGEYESAEQIANTRLVLPGGQTLYVRDVADVRDTTKEKTDISRVNQVDSVAIIIQKNADANTVDVAKGVKAQVEQLKQILPKDLKFVVNSDNSTYVEESVSDVKSSLFLGAFLAVLVVYLFLHNLRGTFIVAIAIPTSIIATFLPVWAFGFTLNGMTLLALSLSVGILVDDSIVVLENIYRHLTKGEEPIEASVNGRGEIGLAAITITLVDVVVFVPIAFMGGVSGQFFRPFGITVAIATLFSLFMSFTLTPMLASRWYKAGEGVEAHRGLFGLFNRFYHMLDEAYRRILRLALKYRGVVVYIGNGLLICVIIAIAASFAGKGMAGSLPMLTGMFVVFGLLFTWRYRLVGLITTVAGVAALYAAFGFGASWGKPLLLVRFAPDQDQGRIQVTGELAAGSTLEKSDLVLKKLEAAIATVPDVASQFASIVDSRGGDVGIGGNVNSIGPQYVNVLVRLNEKASLMDGIMPSPDAKKLRRRDSAAISDEIRKKIGEIPGVAIKIVATTGFQGGGAPLQVDLQGQSIPELSALGQKVLEAFRQEPGVLNPDISTRLGKPEQKITIDRDKAATLGLNLATISATLRTALEGDESNVFRQNGNEYKIRIHYAQKYRQDTAEIGDIVVGTALQPGGGTRPIRLKDVATLTPSTGPTKIDRLDRQTLVSVTGDVAPGFAPGNIQLSINKKLDQMQFGSNSWTWGGENKVQNEEGALMGAALGLAIILVYMLMAALFDSLVTPMVIMLSLPQAMVGALLGLMVWGHALTVVSMIGIIMLMGLVTKNAILLVDYTNTLRERGYSRQDALVEACPTRLRPILMTTVAMVLGMLPTVIGLGRGAEFRAPLASPVIGGLVVSTLLTLVVIPCTYTYFDDASRWIGRVIFRRKLTRVEPVVEREKVGV